MHVDDVVVVGSEVREWALANGHIVADRGRISRQVVGLYRAAIVEAFRNRTPAARFGARGKLLWERLHEGRSFDPTREVMAEEACRITDRLERLDRILTGENRVWVKLADEVVEAVYKGDVAKVEVKLVVDGLLSEARNQAGALRQLLLALGVDAASGEKVAVDPLDEIRARRDRNRNTG